MTRTTNETIESTPETPGSRRGLALAAGVLVLTAAVGALGGATVATMQTKAEIRAIQQEVVDFHADMGNEIDARIRRAHQAYGQADNLERAINEGDAPLISVVSGIITEDSSLVGGEKGVYREIVKNPILLNYDYKGAEAHDLESALEDRWFGYQSTDQDGQVVIHPMQYDAETMNIEPYDSEARSFVIASIDVRPRGEGLHFLGKTLIGLEVGGERPLTNPDESLIQPGLLLSMK